MKYACFVSCVAFLGASIAVPKVYAAEREFTKLFNGLNLAGWHVDVPAIDKDPSISSPFIVRNGNLVSLGSPGGAYYHQ